MGESEAREDGELEVQGVEEMEGRGELETVRLAAGQPVAVPLAVRVAREAVEVTLPVLEPAALLLTANAVPVDCTEPVF